MKKLADIIIKILFGILIVFVIITFVKPELIEQAITWVGEAVKGLGLWNYPILAFVSAIESFPLLGVIIPGQQLTLVIGGFVGLENIHYSILAVTVGAMIGNGIGYVLGKHYGEEFFIKYGDLIGVGETELKYLKSGIRNNGAKFIIFGKFHGLTRSFIPFIAGSLGMQSKKFWIYNLIGSIIWAVVILSLGIVFVNTYEWILDNIHKITFGIMALVGIYIYFFKREGFKKYLREKNEEINRKIEEKENKKR